MNEYFTVFKIIEVFPISAYLLKVEKKRGNWNGLFPKS